MANCVRVSPDEVFPPLPGSALIGFGLIQFGAIVMLIVGWHTRVGAAISWLCLAYVTLVDRTSAFSINSIYLFTLVVIAAFPSKPTDLGMIVGAPVRLLQVALITIYFSSGWNKAVFGDWLGSPTVLETAMRGFYATDATAWALRVFPAGLWSIGQYAVLCFELFSPVLFVAPRLRPAAIIAGCVFHLLIALFMDQLIYFSLQMMSFYVLFLTEAEKR